MLFDEIREELDKQLASILEPKQLKYLMDQEFLSYGEKEYQPLYSDNLIIQKVIKEIRKHFTNEFTKIQETIEEAIQIILDQQNFNDEERKEKYNYLWQCVKIKPQIDKDGHYQIIIDFEE